MESFMSHELRRKVNGTEGLSYIVHCISNPVLSQERCEIPRYGTGIWMRRVFVHEGNTWMGGKGVKENRWSHPLKENEVKKKGERDGIVGAVHVPTWMKEKDGRREKEERLMRPTIGELLPVFSFFSFPLHPFCWDLLTLFFLSPPSSLYASHLITSRTSRTSRHISCSLASRHLILCTHSFIFTTVREKKSLSHFLSSVTHILSLLHFTSFPFMSFSS